jgi:hypothetical protein
MFFTYEWLWNASLAFLNRSLRLTPEQIFSIISTLVIWRFTYEIATRAGWLYVLLLINPLVVGFAFSQLRLAAAISVISFFWRGQNGVLRTIAVYVIATSIHTAILIFAVMHLAAHFLNKEKALHISLLILTGFLVSIAIGPLREMILSAVGDRRAEYHDMSSSLSYLSFWLALWSMLIFRWRSVIRHLDGRYAIVILSIVLFNVLFDGYSTRFIAAAFPSLIIAMARWRSIPISLSVALFVPYTVMLWLYWFRVLGG